MIDVKLQDHHRLDQGGTIVLHAADPLFSWCLPYRMNGFGNVSQSQQSEQLLPQQQQTGAVHKIFFNNSTLNPGVLMSLVLHSLLSSTQTLSSQLSARICLQTIQGPYPSRLGLWLQTQLSLIPVCCNSLLVHAGPGHLKGKKNLYMPHLKFVMTLKSKYVYVYVQYWYLIPHYQLVLNHQLKVACIHGSQTDW